LDVLTGVALFWVLLGVAGAVQPGYDPVTQRISPLAGLDATGRWLGVTVIATAAFVVLLSARRARPAIGPGPAVVQAGAAGLLLGAALVPLEFVLHDALVVGYQALLSGAWGWAAVGPARRGWVAAVAGLGAVVTLGLSFGVLPVPDGIDQRLWTLTTQAFLVALAGAGAGGAGTGRARTGGAGPSSATMPR
jgi:hypothetical protein